MELGGRRGFAAHKGAFLVSSTTVRVILLGLGFASVAACGGSAPSDASSNSATGIVVTLSPPSAGLDACQTLDFGATVTGTSNQGIAWSVKEGPTGGTVTAGGVFTAPSAAGTYHVVATSAADLTKAVEGTITVGPEKVLSVAITPGNGTVLANGAMAFSAIVTTSCGTFAAQ
jgi:hypothetical protein